MIVDSVRIARDASRALARSPGLVAAAVISLGIGVGANLTMFGLLRAIEFPILPYPDASRLIQLDASNVSRGASGFPLSLPDVDDIRRTNRSLTSIAASTDLTMTLRDAAEPARIAVQRVSHGFFSTLGVPAALGRAFTGVDVGLTRTVVVSDRLWREQLNGDPKATGKLVRLDGDAYTVLGVMPPRFNENVDAWIPLDVATSAAPRDDRQYTVIARLRPDVSLDAAATDLAAIAGRLSANHPQTNSGWDITPTPLDRLRARESGGGWFQLQAAVAFLLLVAAANVANLLLARAVGRRREIAIRTALGATRWERFRLVFAEGALLAGASSALGVVLSMWGIDVVTSLAGLPPAVRVPIDSITATAAVALAALVSIVIALAPAAMAARVDADTALRESATRGASASRGQRRLRTLLLCAEVAAALVLVTGATLMARTLRNRQQRELGFEPRNALRGEIAFGDARYATAASLRSAVTEVRRRIEAQPGVRVAGASTFPFAGRLGSPIPVTEPGGTSDVLGANAARVIESVTPGFFAAMATPIRRGRDIAVSDVSGGPLVAVVNEEFARRVWPNADPIGRALRLAATDASGRDIAPTVTVVGVSASALRSSMHEQPLPRLYVAFDQFPGPNVSLFVRSVAAPQRLAGGVKAAVRAVDPTLFVEDLRTLEADEAAFLRPTRLYATMLEAFAALALLLAAIGIYASMSYSVVQRTRELAIRLALGADPARLVRRVLGEGIRVAIVGGLVGMLIARAGGRLLGSLVYGVQTTDPASFTAAVVVLLAVVVAGTWLPARRASVTDPAIALKAD
jgi:putative ABC transport system permease protein